MNVLVEDIVIPIRSLQFYICLRHASQIPQSSVVDKPERREAHVPIHYLGFSIPTNSLLVMLDR